MKRGPAASSSYFWSGGLVITPESTSEQENLIKSSVFIIACVHVWAARVRWRNATLVCGVAEQKLAANDSRGNLIRGKKKKTTPFGHINNETDGQRRGREAFGRREITVCRETITSPG